MKTSCGLLLLNALLATTLLNAQDKPAEPAAPPAADPHAGHAASGIKKELIEGITPADFLKLGDQPKTAKVTLVSAFTQDNYGMNFNGYSKGKATYTIPKGWTVDVTFINPSPVPHSVIVVEREMVRKFQMGQPAFAGASVPNPQVGMALKKAAFTFVADEAGDYVFACGFPAHAVNGHWLSLKVSEDAKVPTLKLGEAEPVEAK